VSVTKLSTERVSLVDPIINYSQLLAQFPKITGVEPPTPLQNRGVFHHKITNGPPVAKRARRLHPKKYLVSKSEFSHLCEAGECRPSDSPWASPIHLVDKKIGNGES